MLNILIITIIFCTAIITFDKASDILTVWVDRWVKFFKIQKSKKKLKEAQDGQNNRN